MLIRSISIARWNNDSQDAIVLDSAFNLAEYSFFQRGRLGGERAVRAESRSFIATQLYVSLLICSVNLYTDGLQCERILDVCGQDADEAPGCGRSMCRLRR